ncbi:MAG: TolC family protein [Ignavibacteriaceae bacterium]|nr:TolC family protein [Ignavibacteriaceae bacterium]
MKKHMKQKILLFFLLAVGSLLPVTVLAQSKTLTLEEAINTALKNNSDIIIATLNVNKAGAAVDEAFGYALPSVDLSANFSHYLQKPKMSFPDFEALLTNATYGILFDENVLPYDAKKFLPMDNKLQSFAQANNYQAQVQLTQTLFNSAVFNGIGASKIYLDLSHEELKRVVSETVLSVKKAFYGVLLTKNLYEVTSLSFKNAQDNLNNVKAYQKEGLVSEFDLLQAEVRVENIRPVLLQMENTLKNSKDGFKIILGIEQSEEIDVTGKLEYEKYSIPAADESVEAALKSNYSLISLRLKKDVDEAFIDLDRSEYWPSLYGFANYSYAGSSEDFKFNNYSSAMVGLTFQINLFKGGQSKNRVEQSEITVKQTASQINQIEDFISAQVKQKLNELRRVESLLDAQERNVKLAQRAFEIATIRYKEGAGNQLEIENADVALRQARTNRLQAVYDYIVAKSEIEQLLGKSVDDYISIFEKE